MIGQSELVQIVGDHAARRLLFRHGVRSLKSDKLRRLVSIEVNAALHRRAPSGAQSAKLDVGKERDKVPNPRLSLGGRLAQAKLEV